MLTIGNDMGPRSQIIFLLALLTAAPAAAAPPSSDALEKARAQLDAQTVGLSKSTDALSQGGSLCQATYFGTAVGPKAAARLKEPKPSSDGTPRDVFATIKYRRDRLNNLVKAQIKAVEEASAKAEASGNGASVPPLSAKLTATTDAAIAAEYAHLQNTIAEGLAESSGYFGRNALAAVREMTVDPNCQKMIQAIDRANELNQQILGSMQKLREAVSGYNKGVGTWAAAVKKPAPPAPVAPPLPPAPPAPTAPVPPPVVQKTAPPIKQETTTKLEVPAPKPEAAKPEVPKIEPAKPDAPKPEAQKPAPVVVAPAVVAPVVVAPVETPKAPAPVADPECVDNTAGANTLPIAGVAKVVGALASPPLPPARPSKLQFQIYAEGKTAAASPKDGIVPYDRTQDLWAAEGSVPWKKYDQEKRKLGILVAPPVSNKRFATVVERLGKNLNSVESRVRLQKAVNELAHRLDGEASRSPTVFQDGVLGSRTKNSVVYYFQKHPKEFARALKRHGFAPDFGR